MAFLKADFGRRRPLAAWAIYRGRSEVKILGILEFVKK